MISTRRQIVCALLIGPLPKGRGGEASYRAGISQLDGLARKKFMQ